MCYSVTSLKGRLYIEVFDLLKLHAHLSTLQVPCLIYYTHVYYSDSGDNWFYGAIVDSKKTVAAGACISKMPFWTTAIINL